MNPTKNAQCANYNIDGTRCGKPYGHATWRHRGTNRTFGKRISWTAESVSSVDEQALQDASTPSASRLNGISPESRARLVTWYGEKVVAFAEARGISIRELAAGEKYLAASPLLSRMPGCNVDAWPIAPAGLFVVAEKTVYIRQLHSDMTLAHEFAHALDCALGGGVYLSGIDPRFRRAFTKADRFVTPYAASACDEFFAECVRAFVEVNDAGSLWPAVSKQSLRAKNPDMFELIEKTFAQIEAGHGVFV